MNIKMNRKNKKGSLEKQIVAILIIVFVLIMVGNGMVIYRIQMNQYISYAVTSVYSSMSKIDSDLYEYKSAEWLIEYWQKYPDEVKESMKRYPHQSDVYYKELNRIENEKIGKRLENVSKEEVEKLSDEDKLLFATFSYEMIKDMFDQSFNNYNLSSIYQIVVSENADGTYRSTYLFYSANPYEEGVQEEVDVPTLGSYYDWKKEEYPSLEELYQGKDSENLPMDFLKIENRSDYRNIIYLPHYEDEQYRVIVVGELLDHTIRAVVIDSIISGVRWTALILLVGVLVVFILFRKNLVNPVRMIQKAVRSFAKDKDSEKTLKILEKLVKNNEIGALQEDIFDMVVEIERYTKEIQKITSEKERIETEMNLAATIQESVLPHDFSEFSKDDQLEVFASMFPAKEVGGDFYDICKLDEDHVMFSIADVSGKGVPAALLMMVTKELIKQNALINPNPAEILKNVNNHICQNNEQCLFVTAWIGVYEISSGTMLAANAGHETPVIGQNGEEFKLFEDDHGLCIGIMEGEEYRNYEMKFEKGDMLFLYTDGVIEAINEKEEQFEVERMLNSLLLRKNDTLENMLNGIREDIRIFEGNTDQFDDITMLAVRIN